MILEKVSITNNNRKTITRICDNCGKRQKVNMASVWGGRKSRNNEQDYCKPCSYKYRKMPDQNGSKSPCWKGGISSNNNGYLRINKTGKYLHVEIYETYTGKKIKKEEKIHHIDGNKVNNDISNLFLCADKRTHSLIHASMEKLGFSLFNKKIWFSKKHKKYLLYKIVESNINFVPSLSPTRVWNWNNSKKYSFVYISYRKYEPYHRYVMSEYLGRKLKSCEHIHHIDGNTLNNDINNLILVNRSEHKIIHNSLQSCIFELFKNGVIKFNKERYYV